MPVNTAALKTFAPAMRRQLLEAVGRKLDLLLHSQTPDTLSTYAKQIDELREQEAENREQLLERVAYTWFNRLCALRYLDARGWHPFGCKVLMPAAEGETQPELLKLMRAGSLPAELKPHTNEARLHDLLDGQIPPAIAGADPQGEVYRQLLLASCRSYHQLLPELFEGLDDASELLLPDDLLSESSIAGGFRSAISDADCEDVEIIGWLYQFYISEKKDQVIGKVVKSEDIPAATQLFTPNWIVKYMVQNSLGATWLATYPNSPLKGQMEFYIEPAEQTPEVQAQLAAITPESLDPETLTLIDPACGSGHILVEAYDLLKAIYLERGYRQRDIPELVLTKNLYGLDICPRAAQLAAFSLLMKGREDDRRLLERGIRLNVMALQDSTGLNVERLAESLDLTAAGINRADIRMLAELFAQATTFGSLIEVPALLGEKLSSLRQFSEKSSRDLFSASVIEKLKSLAWQGQILAQRYDAVVTNPPYMGAKGMNHYLREYAKAKNPDNKADLFSLFISRAFNLCKASGRLGAMTPMTWMFIPSFNSLRMEILASRTLESLIQPEYHSFFDSAYVPICAYVAKTFNSLGYTGAFIRLESFYGADIQSKKVLAALRDRNCGWLYEVPIAEFLDLPGQAMLYWLPKHARDAFRQQTIQGAHGGFRRGFATANNGLYVRQWWEIDRGKLATQPGVSTKRWLAYNKGGPFRKWYGNREHVVRWDGDGKALKEDPKSTVNGSQDGLAPVVSYSSVGSGMQSFRWYPYGLNDQAGNYHPVTSEKQTLVLMSLLNSSPYIYLLGSLASTLNTLTSDVNQLPSPPIDIDHERVKWLVEITRQDWDSYERSWDFQQLPILVQDSGEGTSSVAGRCLSWQAECEEIAEKACAIETENNKVICEFFGLQSEVETRVPLASVSLTSNAAYRYGDGLESAEREKLYMQDACKELLSYATGCMMGRYSLDQPGLILADSRDSQAEQLAAYEEKVGKPLSEVQFNPDPDGIIPVLDGEWFEDDIVARTREFLAVTFPESSVAENLRFIEESLGKEIRKYFCSEFYKDHLQTYKKRPIYWMVQSPKKGFACLIYLHRYTKDTLNQVLNNYFRPYLQKLEARLAQLGLDQLNDDLPTRERTAARKEAEKITKVLKECQAWEQDALLPLAQQRIELDLDDGVKVNYLKLQDVLAPIPGLAVKED